MFSFQQLSTKYIHEAVTLSERYLLFAGVLYLIFYVWKKREFFRLKIQQKYPGNKDIFREMGYSFLSIVIFSTVGTTLFIFRKLGYTKMYLHFGDHSVAYFLFSIVAFILIHDAYFYWTHRFMHWKPIYRYVHKVHHLSTNPTPWAAFAFHPLEALVEVGIVPIMMFSVPLHPLALLTWLLYQFGMNVLGHLGFELYPAGFTTGAISKYSNTSTHHNMHHKYTTSNYGLYFNFWDRLMGTNHEKYTDQFETVKARGNSEAKGEVVNTPEISYAAK